MATNTKIQEFQVDDHDIINLFAWSGAIPVTAGTVVTPLSSSGWRSADSDSEVLGPVGASYGNTLSTRWGTQAKVRAAGSGDAILGILRFDVREVDENGMPLKFYPQKAAENNWVLSGQTVPIINKGFVFISGQFGGSVVAGATAYVSGDGEIFAGSNASTTQVGVFWGAPDNNQFALLQVKP